MTATALHDLSHVPTTTFAERAQTLLDSAPITPVYRSAVAAALALPGNILSDTWNKRWARLVWGCYTAACQQEPSEEVVTVATAVELFMVALDVLDDVEDNEECPLSEKLGPARTLNVSTGLLLLAHWSLLSSGNGSIAVGVLLSGGLTACSGQHSDLHMQGDSPLQLDDSLAVTAQKSASLVSAICRLGALCAGADEATQQLYARFGLHLGMVLQLANDIAGIHPKAQKKTDIALARPTLPLTYAALCATADPETAYEPYNLWTGGAAYLTWTVAEVYRRYALELIPQMTSDPARQAALVKLLPVLCAD